MVVPVSPEFVELCEAQVQVLSGSLGASVCIVYLASNAEPDQATHLIPVVFYPDDATHWTTSDTIALLEQALFQSNYQLQAPASLPAAPAAPPPAGSGQGYSSQASPENAVTDGAQLRNGGGQVDFDTQPMAQAMSQAGAEARVADLSEAIALAPVDPDPFTPEHHELALPLVYKGIVVGLLVTARPDRIWTTHEQNQIEHIARTIATACVVDRRAQWLEARLNINALPQQVLHRQHDVLDDLIHQFRNPLTALRTFGKLLLRRLQSTDRNRDVAESIVRESDRLQDLLTQFKAAIEIDATVFSLPESSSAEGEVEVIPSSRDSARADSVEGWATVDSKVYGQNTAAAGSATHATIDVSPSISYLTGHELQLVPCHLSAQLEPLLVVAQAIAQERNLNLQAHLVEDLPPVQADAEGLREVLSNLIDNALKYTPAGGRILIQTGLRYQDQQAVVIADSGPGIPTQDREHLFERHYRGVQEQGAIPGTGLGLAIARDLVSQMEGDIEVFSPVSEADFLAGWASAAPNSPGTAFVVWLREWPP